MILLKKPNLRRCIRAESLKLKAERVDYDSFLSGIIFCNEITFDMGLRKEQQNES